MEQYFTIIVLLFFAYSFIGWLWETVYCSLKAKHFVYRGFLLGPITPIYGFGIIGVLYLLQPLHQNIPLLFIFSTILVTALEYVTSFLLEKLFHATLWDYKKVPLNINGRVAVPVSIFWGICCVLIVRVVNPDLMRIAEGWATRFGMFLPLALISLTTFDLGFTLANVTSFRKAIQSISDEIESRKQELKTDLIEVKESAESRKDDLKGRLQERQANSWFDAFKTDQSLRIRLPHLNYSQRRLLTSFPNMKSNDRRTRLDEIRKVVQELRK